MVRKCWVNFQCQGVLLTWLTVGQGPIVLSVGAGEGCLDIFSLIYHSPVLRIDNQQNFKIMKTLILLKSFISLFYIIRYILRSMM